MANVCNKICQKFKIWYDFVWFVYPIIVNLDRVDKVCSSAEKGLIGSLWAWHWDPTRSKGAKNGGQSFTYGSPPRIVTSLIWMLSQCKSPYFFLSNPLVKFDSLLWRCILSWSLVLLLDESSRYAGFSPVKVKVYCYRNQVVLLEVCHLYICCSVHEEVWTRCRLYYIKVIWQRAEVIESTSNNIYTAEYWRLWKSHFDVLFIMVLLLRYQIVLLFERIVTPYCATMYLKLYKGFNQLTLSMW